MHIGTVDAIWRFPTKSLAGDALGECAVELEGIPGDRATELVVREGHARIGKAYRGKENNFLHLTDRIDEAHAFAGDRGVTLDEVSGSGHYFDLAPISIILDTWLANISEYMGFDVEYLRFRPNFFVRADEGIDLVEAAFVGREIELGDVLLRVTKPIERCVTPSYDLRTGESSVQFHKYVVQQRNNEMGIYCDVLRAGTVRVGDSLVLVDR